MVHLVYFAFMKKQSVRINSGKSLFLHITNFILIYPPVTDSLLFMIQCVPMVMVSIT